MREKREEKEREKREREKKESIHRERRQLYERNRQTDRQTDRDRDRQREERETREKGWPGAKNEKKKNIDCLLPFRQKVDQIEKIHKMYKTIT